MRLKKEKVRVSGGRTGIARAVLAWSPKVAVHLMWATRKIVLEYIRSKYNNL